MLKMTNKFLSLPYEYDSLEPYIDKETMKIHHEKHHRTYFDNFIATIKGTDLEEKPVEEILSNLNDVPKEIKQKVINQGGGFYNHNFFWEILSTGNAFDKHSEIGKAITDKFSGYDNFKKEFSNSALTLFGSGWVWLVIDKESNELEIIQTKNQDCPLSINKIPLIALDVWEHAYYLKYNNRRAEYVEAFFNIINWNRVEEFFVEMQQ